MNPREKADIVDRLHADLPHHADSFTRMSLEREESATEIASLRRELEAARERNLIANERADNAQADAAKARLLALGEAADAISEKMVEARSFGVEERELTAMGWALDAVRALTERWPPSPRARASGREG